MKRAFCFKNGLVWDGRALICRDLRVGPPRQEASCVDISGYAVFPAWVNAHDHLELNHYPRTKYRQTYPNAHEWGEDVNARLNDEPFHTLRRYPLSDRLFIGGLKNLLCGALTVFHHGPPHKALFRPDFPVRVLRRYGWAHSLHFSTAEEIRASYLKTPADCPWFIHLAEGTDAVAVGEYARLRQLGCVGPNTVLVHAVGMTSADVEDAIHHGVRFVLCPTTNLYLLGQTVSDIHKMRDHFFLGSDSRLTADGDLLDEMACMSAQFPQWQNLEDIARDCAPRLPATALYADGDMIILDATIIRPFRALRRADIALVIRDGVPQIGNPDLMARFPWVETLPARLDGVDKAIYSGLARRIITCRLREAGLELLGTPQGKKRFDIFRLRL